MVQVTEKDEEDKNDKDSENLEFSVEIMPAEKKPFEMEQDLEFRAEFNRLNQRDFEVQEALDRSTIEDLVSYKIKEDKLRNLIVLDDLRV